MIQPKVNLDVGTTVAEMVGEKRRLVEAPLSGMR
jgi:hypothetical protein